MDTGVAAAAGGLLTLVIAAGVKAIIDLTRNRSEIAKTERRDTLDEYRDLIAQLQADVAAVRRERDEIVSKLDEGARREANCEARYARAEERITALEDALTAAGIKHRPWSRPGPGSDTYKPLSPGGK